MQAALTVKSVLKFQQILLWLALNQCNKNVSEMLVNYHFGKEKHHSFEKSAYQDFLTGAHNKLTYKISLFANKESSNEICQRKPEILVPFWAYIIYIKFTIEIYNDELHLFFLLFTLF